MNVPADLGLSVSVIVPCYNGEAFLAECLDSIFGQDRPPEEVVLVDDGSTDGSAEIARRYESRLRYHLQPRQGAGAARNAGVRLAAGNCIAFLDADDIWPSDSLRCRLAVFERDPSVAAVSGLVEHFRSVGAASPASARPLPPVQPGRLLSGMLVRRWLFDRIGGFDTSGRLGDQFSWVASLGDSGLPTVMLDQIVFRRRVHANNMGSQMHDRRADYLHVLTSLIDRRRAGPQIGN